jgi:hypothetical protein
MTTIRYAEADRSAAAQKIDSRVILKPGSSFYYSGRLLHIGALPSDIEN